MEHFVFQFPDTAFAVKFFMNTTGIFSAFPFYQSKHIITVMVEKTVHIKMREIYFVTTVLWVFDGFFYFGFQRMGYALVGVQK